MTSADYRCMGIRAHGSCHHEPRYAISMEHAPLSLLACGVHMPQVVKLLLQRTMVVTVRELG